MLGFLPRGGGTAPWPCPPTPTRLVLAGAETPGEPEALVGKVQEYAQKATTMAKTALGAVRESEAAQQARCPRAPRRPGHPAPPPAG